MEDEKQYRQRINALHKSLGIPEDYELACGLSLQTECQSLEEAELDWFGRPSLLEANTLTAWNLMRAAAKQDDIDLHIISAWRSADYQRGIFQRKLEKGQSIQQILKVNAAPGYSEHHSGKAIDIGTSGFEPLEVCFESSKAFVWLECHALEFGFSLSFPRENSSNILYEPWHWKFSLVSED